MKTKIQKLREELKDTKGALEIAIKEISILLKKRRYWEMKYKKLEARGNENEEVF